MSSIHSEEDYQILKSLFGKVSKEQLSSLDWYIHKNVGIILPSTGPCFLKAINHKHPSYSFILHFDDLYQLEIDNKIIKTLQNTISLMAPGSEHNESDSEKFVRYAAIYIDKEFFEEQFKFYNKPEDFSLFNGNNYTAHPSLKAAIKDFMNEYENFLPGRKQLLDANELKITHLIVRTILNCEINNLPVNLKNNIENVIEYIHVHFNEKLTISSLAEKANLSESHFMRVFKESTGKTPKEYLLLLRLDKAKKMIQDTDKRSSEIALDCGFNNPSHFSNTFQKYFNLSPSAYKSTIK
jgi:AraC-like DNA-binding protein